MSGYTEGPWTINPYTNLDKSIVIPEPGISIDNDDVDHDEARANAHLVVAASDLLNALKECMPCMGWRNMSDEELEHEHELGNGFAKPILRARAAIRKAEGNI